MPAGESMPRYAMPDGMIKLSAAWLIEHAGFAKGYSRGRAGLSSKHALALINRGGATAQELMDLMNEIQSAVHHDFGIDSGPRTRLRRISITSADRLWSRIAGR